MNLSSSPAHGVRIALGLALLCRFAATTCSADATSPPPAIDFAAVADFSIDGPFESVEVSPDTQGAVNSNFVMTVVIPEVLIQDRSGNTVKSMTPMQFWTNGLGWKFNPGLGDPYDHRVFYDPLDQRWIVTGCANGLSTNNYLLVAVSRTSDPTGDWNRYRFPADTNRLLWADWPVTGYSKNWIAVFGTMKVAGTDTYVQGNLYVFDKRAMLTNGAVRMRTFALSYADYSVVAAQSWDPGQDDLPLVHFTADRPYCAKTGAVGGSPGAETLRLGIATGCVDEVWSNQSDEKNFAPQAGITNRIWVSVGAASSCVYRDGSLWFAKTVFLPVDRPNRSAVQWWQLSTNGTVVQHGYVDDPAAGKFHAIPSLAVNRYGDMFLSYSTFSTSQFGSAEFAYRGADDRPGVLRAPRTLKPGEAPFLRPDTLGWNRWSSVSAAHVDPANDTDFWTLQNYAATNTVTHSSGWGTWWGRIDPPFADLRVAVSNSAATAAAGASYTCTVTVSNAGPDAAAETVITNSLPRGAVCTGISASRGTFALRGTLVTGAVDSVSSGSVVVLTMSLTPTQTGALTNAASARHYDHDVPATNNTARSVIDASAAPDLCLVVGEAEDPAPAGGELAYTAHVLAGGAPATGVVVTNWIPAQARFVSASSSQGSCAYADGRVVCALGNIAAGGRATLTVAVSPRAVGVMTNTATVAAAEPDPHPADNTFSAVTTVTSGADLGIAKTVDCATPVEGQTVVFTVAVTNRGPFAASGVIVGDVLPAGVTLVAARGSQGAYDPGTGAWAVGTLGAETAASLSVTCTVNGATSGTSITNTASRTSSSPPDGVATNDASSAVMRVQGADLRIRITDSPHVMRLGADLTYTVSVTNAGPGAAEESVLWFNATTNATVLSVQQTQGSWSSAGSLLTFTLGLIPNGHAATVTVRVRPFTNGVFWSAGLADARQFDPVTTNNSAICYSEALRIGNTWINEIDYDSIGGTLSETNEWVEIAGEAGVSLDDYALAVYLADGTLWKLYDLTPAHWTFADETNGFGFFVVGRPAKAEGTADFRPSAWNAFVLPNTSGSSVRLAHRSTLATLFNVHTVSYGADNPAVEEDQVAAATDSGAALTSICLTGGPGTEFGDFTWTNGTGKATPGRLNAGQLLGVDTDHDSLPDKWELNRFGSLAQSADDDPDGDASRNGDEYAADTDPTDAASSLTLFPMLSAGIPGFTFQTSSARVYRVQATAGLTPTNWVTVGTNFTGSGSPFLYMETGSDTQRFYRVRVRLP